MCHKTAIFNVICVTALIVLFGGCARGISWEEWLANCLQVNPDRQYCYTVYNSKRAEQMQTQEMINQNVMNSSNQMNQYQMQQNQFQHDQQMKRRTCFWNAGILQCF